ncbi:MAG: F0F1 ATP synthase subunit B [Acidimicrobiales bacterium]|nr:F0F1 ATP synthase subunit B [Acidimicrobiales bacterium]
MLVASSNFLVPNATFVVELVAFLLVVFILARYILPPINKVMDERQTTIRQALADAEEAKRRHEEAEAEYSRLVNEGRTQARAVVDEANRMAEQARRERREQADREYDMRVAQASADIEAQARRASEQLREQTADLAIAAAEKVLREGIDRSAQRSLVDRTIEELVHTDSARQPENA